jgi:predicted phage tail protein
LLPGTRYCFRVSTITAFGTSAASSVLSVTTLGNPPAAPTGLRVTATTSSVTLSWTRATVSGGSAVRNYLVEYSRDSGATWTNVTKPVSTSISLRVSGLQRATSYLFRVYAVNDVGQSPASTPRRISTR